MTVQAVCEPLEVNPDIGLSKNEIREISSNLVHWKRIGALDFVDERISLSFSDSTIDLRHLRSMQLHRAITSNVIIFIFKNLPGNKCPYIEADKSIGR